MITIRKSWVALVAVAVVLAACASKSPGRADATKLPLDWSTVANGAIDQQHWQYEARAEHDGGICMRLLVAVSEGSSLSEVQSSCARLDRLERLFNVSVGIVPGSALGYAVGVVASSVDHVSATFRDGSQAAGTVGEGTYIVVFGRDELPMGLVAKSGARVVIRCTFFGPTEPC